MYQPGQLAIGNGVRENRRDLGIFKRQINARVGEAHSRQTKRNGSRTSRQDTEEGANEMLGFLVHQGDSLTAQAVLAQNRRDAMSSTPEAPEGKCRLLRSIVVQETKGRLRRITLRTMGEQLLYSRNFIHLKHHTSPYSQPLQSHMAGTNLHQE